MKAILFIIVIIGGLFFCSDTKWSGSVYRAEDNFFIIQFPKAKWQPKPWFYLKCVQGQKCRRHPEAGGDYMPLYNEVMKQKAILEELSAKGA